MRVRPATAALLLGLLVLASPATARASEWEELYTENGVVVSSMQVEGSPLVAFRGECVIEAPLTKVLWVLLDNDRRVEWVDRLYESEVLERMSDHEYVLYQAFSLPPFMSDRDYVYYGKAVRDAETGRVDLLMSSIEHPKSPETVGVRAKLVNSAYIMWPEGENRTRLAVEIHTDPKGWVPTWLVNLIQKSWPLKTLNGIREQVKKPHVKDYPLPPVEEKESREGEDDADGPHVETTPPRRDEDG